MSTGINDVLSLALHPLQKSVPAPTLLAALERVMVRCVNLVGVDINHAASRSFAAGPLQFVAGMRVMLPPQS